MNLTCILIDLSFDLIRLPRAPAQGKCFARTGEMNSRTGESVRPYRGERLPLQGRIAARTGKDENVANIANVASINVANSQLVLDLAIGNIFTLATFLIPVAQGATRARARAATAGNRTRPSSERHRTGRPDGLPITTP